MSPALTREPGPVAEALDRVRRRDDVVTVAAVEDTPESAALERRAVLAALGRALRFPAYYGRNLDALEECLRDLSWLPAGPVVLVWDDDPLRQVDPDTHRVLLEVLEAATDGGDPDRPLSVVLVGAGRERSGAPGCDPG